MPPSQEKDMHLVNKTTIIPCLTLVKISITWGLCCSPFTGSWTLFLISMIWGLRSSIFNGSWMSFFYFLRMGTLNETADILPPNWKTNKYKNIISYKQKSYFSLGKKKHIMEAEKLEGQGFPIDRQVTAIYLFPQHIVWVTPQVEYPFHFAELPILLAFLLQLWEPHLPR